ncbi:hypothetical protein EG329_005811 [Mollisiaceae sp. DMI_Dod_QoI]|nr:hypothetical protein EG329_005811 [Helotiales sp. DMI_Dod_QoI]
MYLICALGALTLLHGVAARNPNDPRALGLVRSASNGTTTTSTSASSACITTVTSIAGKYFMPVEGSCSQTVTIVSTPQIQSTTVTSPDLSRKQTSSSVPTSILATSKTTNPLSTSVAIVGADTSPSSSSTRTLQTIPTISQKLFSTSSIAQDNGQTSSESPASIAFAQCTATITSTIGQAFVPEVGKCALTVTVVTSIAGNFLQSTSSGSQVTTTALSTPNQKTGSVVKISDTSILSPTTSVAPISTSTSIPPLWIPDGSTSYEISGPPPTSTSKSNILSAGTTTQTPNQTPVTSSSQESTSASNSVATTQTSPSGQAPTHTNAQSTTQVSSILGATTSSDTHPTTQTSQTGSSTSPDTHPTGTTQISASQSAPSSSSGTSNSNSISTQSASAVGTLSHQSSATTTQTVSLSATLSGSGSAPASATQQPSPSNTNTNTNSPSATPTSTSTSISYAPILYGSQTISLDSSSNYIIGGSLTLSPGSAITISGEIISAATGGAIIFNAAPPQTTSTSTSTSAEVIVVGGTSLTANSNSDFILGSQTLSAGGAVTLSGEIITLPSASSSLQTGTGTKSIITSTLTLSPGSPQGPITSLLIAGQTLTAGGKITVGADVLSLASGSGSGAGKATGVMVVSTITVMGKAAPTESKKSAGVRWGGKGWVVWGLVVLGVVLGV